MYDFTNDILDDVECYKRVLTREIKQFPCGFWEKPYSLDSAKKIIRYLVDDKFKMKERDIPQKVSKAFFSDNKLGGMLTTLFNNSAAEAIMFAYPNKFRRFEFKVGAGYWNDTENVKDAIRWLIEEKLLGDRERVCKEFNSDLLFKNNLSTLVSKGIYDCLEIAYPGEYKAWELSSTPQGYWNDETVKDAVRWIIEEKLDSVDDKVYSEFTTDFIKTLGCSTILKRYSLFQLLELAYPNRFDKEKFKMAKEDSKVLFANRTRGPYWTKARLKEKLQEIANDKFKGDLSALKYRLTTRMLRKYGVNTGNSITRADIGDILNSLIREKNHEEKFTKEIGEQGLLTYKQVLVGKLSRFPTNFWKVPYAKELASLLIRYGLEKHLKYKVEDIPTKVDAKVFRKCKLHNMIDEVFNGIYIDAIIYAYPNKFKPWEFNSSKNRWTDVENIKIAVRSFVDEFIGDDKQLLKEKFNWNDLSKYGLESLSAKYTLWDLLDMSYPKKYKPWDLKMLPVGFIDDIKNIEYAVRWIVEENLDDSDKRVYLEFNVALLNSLNLRGITRKYSLFELLEVAYPGRFKEEIFKANYKVRPKLVDKLYLSKTRNISIMVDYIKSTIPLATWDRLKGESDLEKVINFISNK